jgi:hypothetical protein
MKLALGLTAGLLSACTANIPVEVSPGVFEVREVVVPGESVILKEEITGQKVFAEPCVHSCLNPIDAFYPTAMFKVTCLRGTKEHMADIYLITFRKKYSIPGKEGSVVFGRTEQGIAYKNHRNYTGCNL